MITKINSVFFITIALFIIGSILVQPTLIKFILAQQNQTQQAMNQTGSVSVDQVDQQGLASILIDDAVQSIQSGNTPKALSYLTLASQQLSTQVLIPNSGEFNPNVESKLPIPDNGAFNPRVEGKSGTIISPPDVGEANTE